MAEGDDDRVLQVLRGRVGHHHRHDSGVQLDVRHNVILLVTAELHQGLIGGGGEKAGVAQQSSVGEACTEETWLETTVWGEMEVLMKEGTAHKKKGRRREGGDR